MASSKNNRKERNKSHIPFRLNLLFFIIFLLFVGLIMRTGYLQIIKGEEFVAEVERTESTIVRGNVPRGEIYDAELRPLVANEAKNTIMYTRGSNTQTESMAEVAYNLAYLIDVPHASPFEGDDHDVSVRDLKDYFYAENDDLMTDRVEEYLSENNIEANDFSYSDSLELISDAEVMEYSDHELKAAAIFTNMNSAYALSTVNIKNEDATEEEIARVSENSLLLPGVSTGTDWNRVYPQDDTLRSVLGNVSTENQGLPQARVNEYLAKGYSRNDRVGQSLLEAEYENVLRGSKSSARTETDSSGDILSQEEIYAGSKGNNLVLTIDMDFQEDVDQIVLDVLENRRGLNDSAYAVALDPNNGKVLAMSGKRVNEGKIEDHTLGNIQSAFGMGSSVKGATVLSAYMDGVLTPDNNDIVDTPMRIRGSNNISSVFNRSGSRMVNDVTALQYSSNVYMARLAMRMGGQENFEQNQPLQIDGPSTIEKMRGYYGQFGLGGETGIDLPSESTGQTGGMLPGEHYHPLFQSFGQFDTYTPMQLAQYSATIANGGTRYASRLVSEIRETNPETGEVGSLVQEIKPKVMNHINVTDEQMERVQSGFNLVVNGDYGFAPGIFSGTSYQAAGKTGTAQASYWSEDPALNGQQVTNLSFVGYAPYDNPEIAIAVIIPYLPNENTGTDHVSMSRQIFDAYFHEGAYAETEEDVEETEETSEAEE